MTNGGIDGRSNARRDGGRRAVLLGVVCGLLLAGAGLSAPAAAQSAPPAVTTVGTLTLLWALPHGTGAGSPLVRLTTDDGEVFNLEIAEDALVAAGGLMKLDRRRVQVTGTAMSAAPAPSDRPVIQATAIQAVPGPSATPEPLTGPQRFVSILCRFSDSTDVTPRPASYFTNLLGSTYPGINHFWRENSFGQVNNDGSSVVGWFNLPNPRSYYVFDNAGRPGVDFDRTARDCTAAADSSVNFNEFLGINLMFNDLLDCCAWGGAAVLTRDGITKAWPTTWMPPWGYENQDVLGHEMGHAYGLPHSGGQYNTAYDSQWDVMSSGGICNPPHSTFGCIAVHTIGYHKDLLGWIPAARKYTAADDSDQTIYLEDLAAPPVGGTSYHLAKIPIGNSTTNFYTVEARKLVGYDQQIPGAAIVIHEVNTTRDRPAQVVDPDNNGNPNDAGAMWTPGETFAENGVRVNVISSDANGFQVNIVRGPIVPPSNDHFPGANVPAPGIGSPVSFDAFTVAATVQPGEPGNVCTAAATEPSLKKAPLPAGVSAVPTSRTVWYRFTAPRTAELTIDTAGSDFDTVLAVFTGGAVGSLTPVPGACNDDANGTLQSLVRFNATNGTTYYVQAGGFSGASGNLEIQFSGDFVPPPANDNFPGTAVTPPLASAPRSFTASTAGATTQSGEPANVCTSGSPSPAKAPAKASGPEAVPTSKTVWYRFLAPASGELTIDTAGSSFDTVLAVFTGGAVNSLTAVPGACNDDSNGTFQSRVVFTPVGGTTYYVQVGGYSGASGNLSIQFRGNFAGRSAVSDYNGDGKTDFGVYRPANGGWYVALAGGGSTSASWGAAGDVPAPGDYNGDGKTDFGIYRPSNGAWYVALAGGGSTSANWGAAGDVPVPGDYNGDGKTDFGIYRPSNGGWYVALAGGGSTSASWGVTGDVPVPGDYNGDGKTDFGIYRPSNGAWYVALAGGGSTSASWGATGDVPVPGDYNGDGKTDFGIYRPANGGWYVALAGGGSTSASWGAGGDLPAPGDYNGDGKTDFGIYRPSNGGWYVALAGGGSTSARWGATGDIPLPLPHAVWLRFYGPA